jgi:uncharacterized membrane protein YqjE
MALKKWKISGNHRRKATPCQSLLPKIKVSAMCSTIYANNIIHTKSLQMLLQVELYDESDHCLALFLIILKSERLLVKLILLCGLMMIVLYCFAEFYRSQ